MLLSGSSVDEDIDSLCDFTLEEQNATLEAQGVPPATAADFAPVLGKTVTYIVACVLINEQNEVLMIQEAKQSCAGKWYLPAGRMECGETIAEAAVREVLEETGLNVDVTTLLGVECAGGSWFRFILTGRVTGGHLKTPQRADAESLQAKWVQNLSELSLRASDIVPLVELGRSYHSRGGKSEAAAWHKCILPAPKPHTRNYLRVVAVIKKRSNNRVNILLSEKNAYHFPSVEVHPARSIHATLRKFMIELFGAELPQHRPHGILSVEHSPSRSASALTDGLCITVLVIFRPPLEEVSILKSKCVWHEVAKSVDDRICDVLTSRHSALALHVVR